MAGQNRSTAVMARRVEPPDSLDYFPTPPWGTRALCELVLGGREALAPLSVWEPACGGGHMATPLAEYFGQVYASDVFRYGFGEVGDFLDTTLGAHWMPPGPVDWVITNPPFNAAEDFAWRALSVARMGVALFCRVQWLETDTRDALFTRHPVTYCPFIERISLLKGRLDRRARSASAYAWFVFRLGATAEGLVRLRPGTRARFERDEDYIDHQPVDGLALFETAHG